MEHETYSDANERLFFSKQCSNKWKSKETTVDSSEVTRNTEQTQRFVLLCLWIWWKRLSAGTEKSFLFMRLSLSFNNPRTENPREKTSTAHLKYNLRNLITPLLVTSKWKLVHFFILNLMIKSQWLKNVFA